MHRRQFLAAGCVIPLAALPDPASAAAATVAVSLGQGAVSYLGGEAMRSIMGDPSTKDVKRWIRASVEEIKAFMAAELQRQLTEQYLKETIDRIAGMRTDLLDYGASKDRGILLQQFGSNMNTWIEITKGFGLPTVLIYANAVSLRMLVLSAFVKDHRQKQFVERMQATADDGSEHVEAMIAESTAWLDAGIASVSAPVLKHQPRFRPNWDCGYSFRGGREGAGGNSEQEAEQGCRIKRDERIATFKREKEAAQYGLHTPLRHCVAGWKAAADQAKKR